MIQVIRQYIARFETRCESNCLVMRCFYIVNVRALGQTRGEKNRAIRGARGHLLLPFGQPYTLWSPQCGVLSPTSLAIWNLCPHLSSSSVALQLAAIIKCTADWGRSINARTELYTVKFTVESLHYYVILICQIIWLRFPKWFRRSQTGTSTFSFLCCTLK